MEVLGINVAGLTGTPQLRNLLSRLSPKLGILGNSLLVDKSNQDLKQGNSTVLQQYLLYRFLTDASAHTLTDTTFTVLTRLGGQVSDSLLYLECHRLPSDGCPCSFGEHNDDSSRSELSLKSVSVSIERAVNDLYGRIAAMFPTQRHNDTPRILLETQMASSQLLRLECRNRKRTLESFVLDASNCIKTATDILTDVVHTDATMSQNQVADLTALWICTRAEAMLLKLSLLKYQYLFDIYGDGGSVKSLQVIKTDIISKVQALEKELTEARSKVHDYELLGNSFSTLVQEYAKLCSELAHTENALAEVERCD